jgi:beta-aspartyl-peptidase (threonine type)
LEVAANSVVNETLQEAGGEGGLIAVDASGAVALPFNCSGMFRGYVQAGETHTAIWKDWRITPLP